ncbi:MAG: alanine/glycine:cation symporter family protein, partial [Treponemataceae bacterium]
FGIGNMTQANSIASALYASFSVPPLATGIFVSVSIGLVILGGIKRVGFVTERIVPFMALFYMAGGLAIIILNAHNIPSSFGLIFSNAFSFRSVAGGTGGYVMITAMRYGIARGIFSNEAGLGSSAMVHSASNVEEPVEQGLWAIFEVFIDTMVVCTITALLILTSGVYSLNPDGSVHAVASGAALASAAFESLGTLGGGFVAIALTLFAFSTLLGWSYYGERGIEYLFGVKYHGIYKIIFVFVTIIGCVSNLELVWNLSDTFNGLMAIPNLIGITLLSGTLFKLTKDYLKKSNN